MNTTLQLADYLVLAGFFVVMLWIGFAYAARMKNLRDFFGGGRHVPWWIAGISLYMTTFSAFAFVSYSAVAYTEGFVAVSVWWFGIPGCLLTARFLASRWRRAATTSPLEYLETRFSPALRQCFSWFGIPLVLLDDALKLYVIGTMVSVSLGMGGKDALGWSILGCAAIMVLYTLMGGLWAVLVTDFVQFVVIALGVLVLIPLAYARAGGAHAILENVPPGFFHLSSEGFPWPWLLSFGVVLTLTYAVRWSYVQRFYVVRTDLEARKVGYLVAALTCIGPPLLFFPAVAARVFLPGVESPNDVYPLLCKALLPVGMMGVIIAAMFSATMSTLSGDYNAVASVVTNDILKRLFFREASEKTLVRIGRLSTFGAGLISTLIAVALARTEGLSNLVKVMAELFTVLLPPVALPMLAGLLWARASNKGAMAGFALGAIVGISAYAFSFTGADWKYLREIQYLTWITLTPTALGLVLGSLMWPDLPEKQRFVKEFLHGLHRHEAESKPEPRQREDVAFAMRIIGAICAFLGLVLATATVCTAGPRAAWISILSGSILMMGGGGAWNWGRKNLGHERKN